MSRQRKRGTGVAPVPGKPPDEPPPPRKAGRTKITTQAKACYQHQVAVLLSQSVW